MLPGNNSITIQVCSIDMNPWSFILLENQPPEMWVKDDFAGSIRVFVCIPIAVVSLRIPHPDFDGSLNSACDRKKIFWVAVWQSMKCVTRDDDILSETIHYGSEP
jgi:hypothetical protein